MIAVLVQIDRLLGLCLIRRFSAAQSGLTSCGVFRQTASMEAEMDCKLQSNSAPRSVALLWRSGPKMRTTLIILLGSALGICLQHADTMGIDQTETEKSGGKKGKYAQVTVNLDQRSPNVDIKSYVLITNNANADRGEADAIMRLRAKLPLAVQTKDASLFNSILARDFTFRAADEFWNREEYIRERVQEPETVLSARYENVVLQFFGRGTAVSTYRNAIQIKDVSGKESTLTMAWASVYVKEDGQWKIGSVHLIDKK
jgi:Domain of unknown function (DUF4440)